MLHFYDVETGPELILWSFQSDKEKKKKKLDIISLKKKKKKKESRFCSDGELMMNVERMSLWLRQEFISNCSNKLIVIFDHFRPEPKTIGAYAVAPHAKSAAVSLPADIIPAFFLHLRLFRFHLSLFVTLPDSFFSFFFTFTRTPALFSLNVSLNYCKTIFSPLCVLSTCFEVYVALNEILNQTLRWF